MTLDELRDQYLLENLDIVYEAYRTLPLEGLLPLAVSLTDVEGIKILLKREVDVNETSKYDNRPLHILAESASENNIEKVIECANLLLDARASIIRKNMMGESPVIIAVKKNAVELIEVFVKRNLKLHFTDSNGDSPLHIAVSYSNSRNRERSIQIIRLLMEAEADTMLKNMSGESPIDIAINRLKDPMIAAILKGSYDFENPDSIENLVSGISLHGAILARNYEIIKAHLEWGSDINEISEEENDSSGRSPLGTACFLIDFEAVKLLVEKGADVNLKNSDGETALSGWFKYLGSQYFEYEAAEGKLVEKIIKQMIEHHLNLNDIIDEKGNTLLLKATEFINRTAGVNNSTIPLQTIVAILRENIDVNLANLEGTTALMNLCKEARSRDIDLIAELLEMNADVGTLDKKGNTAMMYVAQNTDASVGLEIAKLLYDFGDIKLSHVNNDGKSVMEFAVADNNENLVNWILTKL